jgi:3-hydroxyisobutyrate dehydrogenase
MTASRQIAVLGTGLLGRAVAERLHTVGNQVIAFNRTFTKALPLQSQGITVVKTAEQAVSQADCSLLLLTDAAAIRALLFADTCLSALKGKVIVQMGTIRSDESVEIQQDIERCGGTYLEAPVLGSMAEAKAGTLLVMVGASEPQYAVWSPLFRSLSRDPRYIGPVGSAAALKLALNHLIAAETVAFAFSLGLVQRSGVSVEPFMAILRESALYAPTFDKKLPRLLKRDYDRPNFSTGHLLKDVLLFAQEAAALGLPAAALEGLPLILQRAIAKGLGDQDYSALFEAVSPAGPDRPLS